MRMRTTTAAAVLALVLASVAGVERARADGPGWATAQAIELTRQARENEARGDRDTARVRYEEALRFDATYGPAYLGLAAMHEAAGRADDAERTYAVGLDHVVGFADGYAARARLRVKLLRRAEAALDFEAACALRPADRGLLRELGAAYVSIGALPAALTIERRAFTLAEAEGDARGAAQAKAMMTALARLVAEVDPVRAGERDRGAVRRAIALADRRR